VRRGALLALVAAGALAVLAAAAVLDAARVDLGRLETRPPFPTALMRARERQARHSNAPHRIDCRWVPYDRISPLLRRAVLVAEDDAFFQHGGLDWSEIGASARRNLERGRVVRGGSTITQQLARNLFLGEERTPARKLKEIVLALRIEREGSKHRILELYLNLLEWGDGIYGAEAAARRYFGTTSGALDARQALLLASVIINPRRFSPLEPSGRIERRVRTIASRMHRRGQLGDAEYRLAVGEPPAKPAGAAPGTGTEDARSYPSPDDSAAAEEDAETPIPEEDSAPEAPDTTAGPGPPPGPE